MPKYVNYLISTLLVLTIGVQGYGAPAPVCTTVYEDVCRYTVQYITVYTIQCTVHFTQYRTLTLR